MKKVLVVLAMIVIAFVAVQTQAASATSTADATVITPISITNTAGLNFGKFAAGTGGTVVMAADGTRTKTGAVVLATGTSGAVASFDIAGDANATYAITLPSVDQSIASGANTMVVKTFTSSPATSGTLSSTGASTVKVGATLTVGSAQAVGTYTGSFSVSVEYN